jgi:hypothetical protein
VLMRQRYGADVAILENRASALSSSSDDGNRNEAGASGVDVLVPAHQARVRERHARADFACGQTLADFCKCVISKCLTLGVHSNPVAIHLGHCGNLSPNMGKPLFDCSCVASS